MAVNNGFRVALFEPLQQLKQCGLLRVRSGVGGLTLGVESSTIRNANGVFIMLQTMSACLLDGAALEDISGLVN